MANEFLRGSEWKRWDLHIHTPSSYLANEFGDPAQAEVWDSYITSLFQKALEKEIVAIGITDYFSIEGYEKVLEYQKDTAKLTSAAFGFSEEQVKKIQAILLLPNIELRLKCIVGTNRVNLHVMFSNEINVQDIKENFLENLSFVYEGNPGSPDYKYKLKKLNLEALGTKLQQEQAGFAGKLPIEVGAMNAVVDDEEITKILSEAPCFKNKYLICTPVDEDLPRLPWISQDHQVRKVLYQKSSCFLPLTRTPLISALVKSTPPLKSLWPSSKH